MGVLSAHKKSKKERVKQIANEAFKDDNNTRLLKQALAAKKSI